MLKDITLLVFLYAAAANAAYFAYQLLEDKQDKKLVYLYFFLSGLVSVSASRLLMVFLEDYGICDIGQLSAFAFAILLIAGMVKLANFIAIK